MSASLSESLCIEGNEQSDEHSSTSRTIRASADAQHSHENFFITVLRPILVELVKVTLNRSIDPFLSCSLDRNFSANHVESLGWMQCQCNCSSRCGVRWMHIDVSLGLFWLVGLINVSHADDLFLPFRRSY